MLEGDKKKRSRVRFYRLAVIGFALMVGIASNANIVLAQELSEDEKEVVMIQYTLKYRFDKDLKIGDWVKYQWTQEGGEPQEHEIRVTEKEKGGVWIVEKFEDGEIHLLVDLKSMNLLKGFGFDEEGERHEASPLSDKELSEAVEMMQKEMEQQMKDYPISGWKKGTKKEEVEVLAGSFTCSYLEPEYSEKHIKAMQDYGMSPEKIKETMKEMRLYFSEDVPRLLPVQIAGGWAPFIEAFQEIKGGLVESPQMGLELTAYSGQK
ncbi:hypothetical protein CH333_09865 [candidate division WOR-3 bacterium JGI_Cruoil_03_44_89]|uniref:Uncharacterized protein n=1 Tax=candidate division WOR-3 bacterium JGI_Cruoil_03_44_89 TaxID=1973748 RepID=A0A235BNP9_UNCW3|nr:MAG: hypothetical protein CH333_09865 [candidate division WOR-3 bacterium JGI_Cruoil_03_44_89]